MRPRLKYVIEFLKYDFRCYDFVEFAKDGLKMGH